MPDFSDPRVVFFFAGLLVFEAGAVGFALWLAFRTWDKESKDAE